MSIASIQISKIRRDGGTQARVGTDREVAGEYARVLKDGVKLPPPVVFHDGKHFWLADGFHTLTAHELNGEKRLNVDVRKGDLRSAVLYATGANAHHGLPRSNADKRKAVGILLDDDEWTKWSNVKIAKHCSVNEGLIRKMRRENGSSGSDIRRERGGCVYFIQSATGAIKIGHTTSTAEIRLEQMQGASAEPLTLLAHMPGSAGDEQDLHQRFAASGISGEWFRPSKELLKFVGNLTEETWEESLSDEHRAAWNAMREDELKVIKDIAHADAVDNRLIEIEKRIAKIRKRLGYCKSFWPLHQILDCYLDDLYRSSGRQREVNTALDKAAKDEMLADLDFMRKQQEGVEEWKGADKRLDRFAEALAEME